MTRYVRMPWDEPTQYRWTPDEVATGLRLRASGLDYRAVADCLAEAGFPPRDETDVASKLRAAGMPHRRVGRPSRVPA